MNDAKRARMPTGQREHALELLHGMLRIRRFEEKAAELYTLGKISGFLHLYIGEEAVGVGAMRAFKPDDAIVTTYREHGHALARGLPAGSLLAEMFGKANDCSAAARCTPAELRSRRCSRMSACATNSISIRWTF
jgi:TPP-dependent pyruvate/acetoin dehydrogenase alpha subunit